MERWESDSFFFSMMLVLVFYNNHCFQVPLWINKLIIKNIGVGKKEDFFLFSTLPSKMSSSRELSVKKCKQLKFQERNQLCEMAALLGVLSFCACSLLHCQSDGCSGVAGAFI